MQFEKEYKSNANIPVKIMIAELLPESSQRTIRSVISPIVQYMPSVQPKYGIFHTAIVIGPYLLDWTDGCVCVPRVVADNAALLAYDVAVIKNVPLNDVIDQLCKLISRWNLTYTYCLFRMGGKRANEGNCQDFIEEVMRTLNISFTPEGYVLQQHFSTTLTYPLHCCVVF